jgi:hypothetical protein
MATIVLGAGATRGASFVGEWYGEDDPIRNFVLPPLDTDFYAQLQRIYSPKHRETVDGVIEDTVGLFGPNFKVTLETVFTTLENMLRMVERTGDTRDFRVKELLARRQRLIQAIAAVLEESMCAPGTRDMIACKHHNVIARYLTSNDRVISFNHDLLMDHSLRLNGGGKWNPKYGYGFKLKGGGAGLTGYEEWAPKGPETKKKDSLRYYKLHGSLHFLEDEKKHAVALKARPYTTLKGKLHFSIIPPESNKNFDKGVFGDLWTKAARDLQGVTTLVFIGYSMPSTDLHSAALFRVFVPKERLRSLVIVNPNQDARRRTRDAVRRGLSKSTRVVVFDSLREFVETPRELWDADLWPPKAADASAKTAIPGAPAPAPVHDVPVPDEPLLPPSPHP